MKLSAILSQPQQQHQQHKQPQFKNSIEDLMSHEMPISPPVSFADPDSPKSMFETICETKQREEVPWVSYNRRKLSESNAFDSQEYEQT
jgi:hypothetical protein